MLLVVGAALIFSVHPVLTRWVGWSALAVFGVRACVEWIVGQLYLRVRYSERPTNWRKWFTPGAVLWSGLAFAASNYSYIAGVTTTNAMNATVLCYTSPFFAALMSIPILKRRITRSMKAVVVLGTVGVMFFFCSKSSEESHYGEICAVLCGLFWALHLVILEKIDSPQDQVGALMVGFSLGAPFALFAIPGLPDSSFAQISTMTLLGVISFVPFIWCVKAMKTTSNEPERLESFWVSSILLIEPIVAPFLAWQFLDEVPNQMQYVGATFLLASVIISIRVEMKNAK